MNFYSLNDEECAQKFGVTQSGVALFRNFEEKVVAFEGIDTTLEDWANTMMLPLFYRFEGMEDKAKVFNARKPTLMIFDKKIYEDKE